MAIILFSAPIFAGTSAACARPVFLQALSDSELAENRAGGANAFHLEETVPGDRMILTGIDTTALPGLAGIRTIALDTGTSSLSQATTAITLHATLQR